jgi:hypothetical protein
MGGSDAASPSGRDRQASSVCAAPMYCVTDDAEALVERGILAAADMRRQDALCVTSNPVAADAAASERETSLVLTFKYIYTTSFVRIRDGAASPVTAPRFRRDTHTSYGPRQGRIINPASRARGHPLRTSYPRRINPAPRRAFHRQGSGQDLFGSLWPSGPLDSRPVCLSCLAAFPGIINVDVGPAP